jgi:hypothetical protein
MAASKSKEIRDLVVAQALGKIEKALGYPLSERAQAEFAKMDIRTLGEFLAPSEDVTPPAPDLATAIRAARAR